MPSDPFYRSQPWRRLRAITLRDFPACQVPGCPQPSSHVDHVQTRRQSPHRELDPSNVQALCVSHHSSKTAQADGGFGNRRGVAVLRVKGCDANGVPLDPSHRWRS